MKGRWELFDHLAQGADLPEESLPGQSIVEILEDRRVLIENHHGVREYGTERIWVNVRRGQVLILGCDLELTCMTRDQLIISGKIKGVTLTGRNG